MKILSIKILLLFFFFPSFSQVYKYKFTYINFNDTLEPAGIKLTNTVLTDNLKSVSYKLPYEFKTPGSHVTTTFNGKKKFEFYSEKDTIKVYVFKDISSEGCWFQSEYGPGIVGGITYSDSLHPFKWTISEEKRKINDQVCKKATMRFRGRNYTAWFCELIPIQNGPWKFGGLPGLIIEIYDETFTVYWRLTKFISTDEQLPDFPGRVELAFSDYKKRTKESFLKLKASIESMNGVENPDCKNCTGTTKTVTDNSVELITHN